MQHVDDTLARASIDIAGKLLPGRVVALDTGVPNSLEEATRFWHDNGSIAVSTYTGPTRFLGTPECNRAFDAWHDFCHVSLQATFDMDGEERVNAMQQAHLMQWHTWAKQPATAAEIKRASAMLNMNNLGRLQHWRQWDNPPADTRSFAQGWLAALGMACKPRPPVVDLRNEWTDYGADTV